MVCSSLIVYQRDFLKLSGWPRVVRGLLCSPVQVCYDCRVLPFVALLDQLVPARRPCHGPATPGVIGLSTARLVLRHLVRAILSDVYRIAARM